MSAKTRRNAPDRAEIALSEAATRLGLTLQAAGMWARRAGAPARADGRRVWVAWPAFARWREQALIEAAMPNDIDVLRGERLRLEIETARLELAKRQGLFVTVDDFGRAFGVILDRLVARARALPVRLAHLGDVVEAEAEREVEAMLTELRELTDDVLVVDDAEAAEVPDAA